MATDHNFKVKNGLEVQGANATIVEDGSETRITSTGEIRFRPEGSSSNKVRITLNTTHITGSLDASANVDANQFRINGSIVVDSDKNIFIGTGGGKVVLGSNATTHPHFKYSSASESRHHTTHGYISFGPQNTTGAHIYTDRDRFYFNKKISLIDNKLISYDDDLQLRREDADANRIVIGDGVTTIHTPRTVITGTGTNNTPSTDHLQLSGYGIIGNRGTVYLTNSNSSGTVQIGVGAAHNNNPKVIVSSANTRFNTPITMSGAEVIDSSRNITAGTIDSGAITSSGAVYGTEFDLPSGSRLDWANGDARIVEGLVNNYSLSFQTYDGSNLTTALRLDGDNTATFAGTISSGAITTSSLDASGNVDGNAFRINGTEVISVNRVFKPAMYTGANFALTGTTTVHNHVMTGALLGTNAEEGHISSPFIHNDLANFVARGGVATYGGLNGSPGIVNAFKPNSAFVSWSSGNYTGSTMTLTLTSLPKNLNYGGFIGISFGNTNWAPASCKIEVSTDGGSTWTTRLNNSSKQSVYFTSTGAGSTAVNAIRFTLGQPTSSIRLTNIWAYNYDSSGMLNYFFDKAGGTLEGIIASDPGNATTPAYSFSSDDNTGMYRYGADTIGFSTGGINRAYLNSTGLTLTGTLTSTGLDMSASSSAYVNLNRSAFITFYGNGSGDHGISSRNIAGSAADDLRINSYANAIINLDSNSNNSADADLIIGRHGGGTGAVSQLHRISGEQGTVSSFIGGNATYSKPLLEITSSATPTQIKITTNIPYSGSDASTHAHSVTIRGFQYGGSQMADLQIGWHVYQNEFYNRSVTSSGSWAPTVTLAVENNKVVIHLASPGYWPKIYVESMYNAFGGSDQAIGWTWADAAISADANTPNQTVPYKANFGNSFLMDSSGNVGISGNLNINGSTHNLTVAGSGSAENAIQTTNGRIQLGPQNSGAGIWFDRSGSARYWFLGLNDSNGTSLRFYRGGDKLVLDSSGNMSVTGTLSSGAITTTGRLTLPDGGYSIGNELHVWKRDYSVNASTPRDLLYHDGTSLPNGGAYRVQAHIYGTGTDQSATAVFWNQDGTWKVNVTYQSGTSSNHPEFIVGSNGKPQIIIDHASLYTISVLHERLELAEGTGTDNKSGFGADGYLSEVSGVLRHNPNGGSNYTSGNRVFADNYHPNADKWTTARTLSLTGDVTGSVSWDGSADASISTTLGYTETDTLDSVTDRGATTTNAISTGAITSSGNITSTQTITGDTISLTNDATNTSRHRISVYDSGTTSYGMMLWNRNGTSGDWSTMIYGPNQDNRRISFGKITGSTFDDHGDVTESMFLDLDNDYLYIKQRLAHYDDSDTYLQFDNDRIRLVAGGATKIDSTVAGSYGSIVVNDFKNSWAGYSINNAWVFMADGATNAGIYNDTDNEWAIKTVRNSEVVLYHNGSTKLQTTSTGIDVTGNITHDGLTPTSGTDIDQIYTAAQTLTITTSYQDTGINASELAGGTYIVQLTCNDHSVGGAYSMMYSGVMSWYSGNTNDNASDEIVLHRTGHASVQDTLYLRTRSTLSADTDDLKLQIKGNYNATGSSTYTFKFRRMI